jgi:uncharacterized protein YecE (DUF72 family)
MDRLGDKLGPLLLQFPYFNKARFPGPGPFIARLAAVLRLLPREIRFVVEVRNKTFVTPALLDLLARYRVALAFIDHPWFFRIDELLTKGKVLTTDFAYVRWLGDRKGIEQLTDRWDRTIVDRTEDLRRWVSAIREITESGHRVLGYVNNHYAGYAIDSIRLLRKMWNESHLGASGAMTLTAVWTLGRTDQETALELRDQAGRAVWKETVPMAPTPAWHKDAVGRVRAMAETWARGQDATIEWP